MDKSNSKIPNLFNLSSEIKHIKLEISIKINILKNIKYLDNHHKKHNYKCNKMLLKIHNH